MLKLEAEAMAKKSSDSDLWMIFRRLAKMENGSIYPANNRKPDSDLTAKEISENFYRKSF